MSEQLFYQGGLSELNIPPEEQNLAEYAREMLDVANNLTPWYPPERTVLAKPAFNESGVSQAFWEYETERYYKRIAVNLAHQSLILALEERTFGEGAHIHASLSIFAGVSQVYSHHAAHEDISVSDFKEEFLTTAKAFQLIERQPLMRLVQNESSFATSERVA